MDHDRNRRRFGKSDDFNQRFWLKVSRVESGCWLWLGCRNKCGYGQVKYQGTMKLAHRVAFEITVSHPGRFEVMHSCDTPACVNPAHLALGTHRQNMRDMVARGRSPRGERNGNVTKPGTHKASPGEANGRAKLSWADVTQIRSACSSGELQRDVATRFGITQTMVSRIVRNKAWRAA